jgi:hypothetical protein
MSKKYTIQDFMTGYKYAYIATARTKKELLDFQNSKTWFVKALSNALERDIAEKDVNRSMFKRAQLTASYYVMHETDNSRRHYLMHIMNKWSYMNALFNGVLPLEALKECADARIRRLGVEKEVLEKILDTCFKKGMSVEDLKRAIAA